MDYMDYIRESELIKLLDILRENNISIQEVLNLCKINNLLDLNMQQYNILLHLICLRRF